MTIFENFEKLCKNCGRKWLSNPPLTSCPTCHSKMWERVGARQYCKEHGCSLTLHHKGDCVPWPQLPPRVERGSSKDYAPEVEGDDMQIDEKDGQVGVYQKYEVRRTDHRDDAGEKHEGCSYFVLDLTHDPHAVPALRAYAESCRRTHPALAIDLWKTVGMGEEDPDVDLELWRPLPTLEQADNG